MMPFFAKEQGCWKVTRIGGANLNKVCQPSAVSLPSVKKASKV